MMKKLESVRAALAAIGFAFPSGVVAQEVTPDNIATRAAQCFDTAETAVEKLACVGADQPACQAWLKASDPAYVEIPFEAVSFCTGAEYEYWVEAVDRELGYAADVLDVIDASLLAKDPETPEHYFVVGRLFDSQQAWRRYADGFCMTEGLSAVLTQRDVRREVDCRLAKYGARAVELWQMGAMFE